jgi:hypothetical protein
MVCVVLLGSGLVSAAIVTGHYGWTEYIITLSIALTGVSLIYGWLVVVIALMWDGRNDRRRS